MRQVGQFDVATNQNTGDQISSDERPALIYNDLTIAVDTTLSADVFVTGDLVVNVGFILTVQGELQVEGNITIDGGLDCFGLSCANDIDNPGALIIRSDLKVYGNLINAGAINCMTLDVGMDLTNPGSITTFGQCSIGHDIVNTGTMTTMSLICGNNIDNTGATSLTVNGNCNVSVDFINAGCTTIISGNCQIGGNFSTDGAYTSTTLQIGGDFTLNGANNLIVNGNFSVGGSVVHSAAGVMYIWGNCKCGEDWDNTGGDNVDIHGDCHIGETVGGGGPHGTLTLDAAATFTVIGHSWIDTLDSSSTGDLIFRGNLQIANEFICSVVANVTIQGNFQVGQTITNVGNITCMGTVQCGNELLNTGEFECLSLECGGIINNTGATSLTVNGDCVVGGGVGGNAIINAGCTTQINGDCKAAGSIQNGVGTFTVEGNCECENVLAIDFTDTGYFYVSRDLHCDLLRIRGDGGSYVEGRVYATTFELDSGSFNCGSMEFPQITIQHTQVPVPDLSVDGYIKATSFSNDGGIVRALSLDIQGNLACVNAVDIVIGGNLSCGGSFSSTAATASIEVEGNLFVGKAITNAGILYVSLDVEAGDSIDNTGTAAADFEIYGNLKVPSGSLTNTVGGFMVSGKAEIRGIAQTDATSTGWLAFGSLITGTAVVINGISSFAVDQDMTCLSLTLSRNGDACTVGGNLIANTTVGNSISLAAGTTLTVGGKISSTNDLLNAGTVVCAKLESFGALNCTGATSLTVDGEVFAAGAFTVTGAAVITTGNLHCGSISNTSTGAFTVNGTLNTNGNMTINSAAGATTVKNDVHVGGVLTTGTTATLTVYGNAYVYDMAHASSGALFIGGNLEMGTGIISSGGGAITIDGNTQIATNWNNTNGGNIIITGEAKIAGTLTMNGTDTWTSGNLHCGAITNSSSGTFTVNGNMDADANVAFSGSAAVMIDGNAQVGSSWNNTLGGNITIKGKADISDTLTMNGTDEWTSGNLHCGVITNSSTGAFTVNGNLEVDGAVTFSGANAGVTVDGNVLVGSNWNNTGGGNITITGANTFIAGTLTMDGADTWSSGNLQVGTITNSSTGTFTVNGDLKVTNDLTNSSTATITVNGDLKVADDLTNSNAGGTIVINGKYQVWGTVTNAGTLTIVQREVFSLDFWSNPQEAVAIPAAAADQSLPDVTVSGLPSGCTVVRAVAMFKFRTVENTNAGANKLSGAQDIQVRTDAPGAWADAINFLDDMFGIAASTREGGDVFIGDININTVVTGDDTYNFQWDEAVADLATLEFNDVQVGIRLWYAV